MENGFAGYPDNFFPEIMLLTYVTFKLPHIVRSKMAAKIHFNAQKSA